MKIVKTVCDICEKDISGDFQYRFFSWHYRIGKQHKFYMCNDCRKKFIEFVKNGNVNPIRIRNRAIDEFADRIIIMMPGHTQDILQMAEQLKG